ncbi:UNVERIFIED_ORG: hypothetical protein DFO82_1944 [Idiomarina abyssalis]|uniref:type II toxin-antitoxin system RelE/ParE family toxin n=1 Tax=Idiomarina sp. 017G TaxID=2183988 RepID=UPI000E0F4ACD|nr:type II toxin-antitoxin system RelE/ParE family toxin [Idiomarina sp. 017G]TDO48223.1 hypothetical protein DEU30_107158 [Idiomarina sp. 017G]
MLLKYTLTEYTLIYKTKEFASLMKKEAMSDEDLINACKEMSKGLIDADLGGNVYKKRIAYSNKEKRGGYRTIVGAVIGKKYFFLYVFAKNKKTNISSKEKVALKELARMFISFDKKRLGKLVKEGELIEVGDL